MSLVLSPKKTRKIKIKAIEPLDLIASKEHDFIAEFKIISNKQWKALLDDEAVVIDVVKMGLKSVSGISDESGKDVQSSPELIDALLLESWILNPLFTAQLAIQGGVTQSELYKKVKAKN